MTDIVDDLSKAMDTAKKKARGPTEDDLALRFAATHQFSLKFVAFWPQWLRWRGHYWATDKSRQAFDLVRRLIRQEAKELVTAKRVAAVHQLAQSDRRIAAESEMWDRDLDCFNCTPNEG